MKKSDGSAASTTNPSLNNTAETLWALSLDELGHNATGTDKISALNSRYELFVEQNITKNSAAVLPPVTITDGTEICDTYWTRHLERIGTWNACYVSHTNYFGKVGNGWAGSSSELNTKRHVRFGFCI